MTLHNKDRCFIGKCLHRWQACAMKRCSCMHALLQRYLWRQDSLAYYTSIFFFQYFSKIKNANNIELRNTNTPQNAFQHFFTTTTTTTKIHRKTEIDKYKDRERRIRIDDTIHIIENDCDCTVLSRVWLVLCLSDATACCHHPCVPLFVALVSTRGHTSPVGIIGVLLTFQFLV